jgi:predicted RNA-binding protein with EMAP domain
MFDWFSWGMGILQGTITFLIGSIIVIYYIVPKMMKNLSKRTINELKNDPEIKPLTGKVKEIIDKLHPLMEQFKNIDLAKTQSDFAPLIEGIKKIDPKEIEGLIKNIREITGTIKSSIEKPKLPPPPEE